MAVRGVLCLILILLCSCAIGVHCIRPGKQRQAVDASSVGWTPYPDLPEEEWNDRPIIGILSQPGSPAPQGMSYIAASYVKWVESAGARAVPILYDMSEKDIRHRYSIINGLLLPGGGAPLQPGHEFYDTARWLVELAVKSNQNGDYFPVHGTCLGLETLSVILTSNYTILSSMDAEDAPAELLLTSAADTSYFFNSLPPEVVKDLQNTPIAMENHAYGVTMAAYQENQRLKDFFKVLSLSIDKSGNAYISTMESRDFPITATQWHPEKNAFEWTRTLHIPHTPAAVRMSQEVANFFVNEARRNQHAAKNTEEEDSVLIYNWEPHYTGKAEHAGEEKDFEQCYFFDAYKDGGRKSATAKPA